MKLMNKERYYSISLVYWNINVNNQQTKKPKSNIRKGDFWKRKENHKVVLISLLLKEI